jgi:hypothetical protein
MFIIKCIEYTVHRSVQQGYAPYFNRTFAYEIYYYGIYFYEIYFYGFILLQTVYTSH